MKDREIKKNRKEVFERYPEIGIRMILKYGMYLGGNILTIKHGQDNITIFCDSIRKIESDQTTVMIKSEHSTIILWKNPRIYGFDVSIF